MAAIVTVVVMRARGHLHHDDDGNACDNVDGHGHCRHDVDGSVDCQVWQFYDSCLATAVVMPSPGDQVTMVGDTVMLYSSRKLNVFIVS